MTIILSLHFCSLSTSLNVKKDLICWNENPELLDWKDFKGAPDVRQTEHAAVTCIRFYLEVESGNSISLNNCMIKDKSWVKKDAKDSTLLIHERYHFHISEVYARKMRREISELPTLSKNSLQDVYDKWNHKYLLEQKLYDEQTNLSRNLNEQLKWQEKIDNQLDSLDSYKDKIVFLKH